MLLNFWAGVVAMLVREGLSKSGRTFEASPNGGEMRV